MEQFETFSNYINGNLNSQDEQSFFSAMNLNEELRSEFRRFIVLDRTFKQTSGLFIPPNNVTNKIYTGLGFSIPSIVTPVPVEVAKTGLNSLFKFISTGFLSALVASILTFYVFVPSGSKVNEKESFNASNKIIQPNDKNYLVSKNYSKNDLNKDIKSKRKLNLVSSTDSIKNFENENINNDKETINHLPEKIVFNSSLTEKSYIPLFNSINPKISSINFLNNNQNIEKLNISSSVLGFVLEIKNSLSWNVPKETIYPNELSKFNNMSIALLYKLNNAFEFGVDARQETFFVKYTSIDSNSMKYIFEQQPNLTSFGILLRYKTIISDDYMMLLQSNFASNYYGLIARAGLGIEIPIYPELSLSGVFEYSNLFYQHQGNWNSSGKIGINYGIIYKF